MFKVTLQSLAAKKLRLVLTSIAVVLGVAFMSGTFVLTDTLGSVFDNLFADTTKGVDAVVRSRKAFEADDEQGRTPTHGLRCPRRSSRRSAGSRRSRAAQGTLLGYALVIGKDGDAVQNQAPTLATPWRPPNVSVSTALDIQRGHGPRAPDQVMVDKKTLDDGGFADRAKDAKPCPPPTADPTAGPKYCVKINFLSVAAAVLHDHGHVHLRRERRRSRRSDPHGVHSHGRTGGHRQRRALEPDQRQGQVRALRGRGPRRDPGRARQGGEGRCSSRRSPVTSSRRSRPTRSRTTCPSSTPSC